MNYTIEKDGGGTRLLLANGDRLTIKMAFGDISPTGEWPDGTTLYHVQCQTAIFVQPSTETKSTSGKH